MYAHPAFLRGRPELLTQLQKCKNAADRKRNMKISVPQTKNSTSNSIENKHFSFGNTMPNTPIQEDEVCNGLTRTVSPCVSQGELSSSSSSSPLTENQIFQLQPQSYRQESSIMRPNLNTMRRGENIKQPSIPIPELYNDVSVGGRIGKIGLLALAMRYVVEVDEP